MVFAEQPAFLLGTTDSSQALTLERRQQYAVYKNDLLHHGKREAWRYELQGSQ